MTREEKLKEAKRLYESANADQRYVLERLFPELKEREDERVWRELIEGFKRYDDGALFNGCLVRDIIAWLEKQGEHARFIEAIQIGDQVTKNEDGVLVNLSQLKRVAKTSEQNQGEQKPAWSEEDDIFFKAIIRDIENTQYISEYAKKDRINWLKSLKPQNTWKPSDEQMEALKEAVDEHFDIDGGALWHLYEDLKKLME